MSYLIKVDGVKGDLATSKSIWEEELGKNGISINVSHGNVYAVKDRFYVGSMPEEQLDYLGKRILKLNSIVPDKYGKVEILEKFGFSQGASFKIPSYKEPIQDKTPQIDIKATIQQLKKDLGEEEEKNKNQK